MSPVARKTARAKAMLRHFIEIATGPRIELVGFPRISETSA
jgi:hypothetical protein